MALWQQQRLVRSPSYGMHFSMVAKMLYAGQDPTARYAKLQAHKDASVLFLKLVGRASFWQVCMLFVFRPGSCVC